MVAAALIEDGRVLAALRNDPPGWEFPGGKVEPGESPQQALERECDEELGIGVRCLDRIATVSADHLDLHVWRVQLVRGTPTALNDHRELRWLGVDDLPGLDWLPLDRAVLDAIADRLR